MQEVKLQAGMTMEEYKEGASDKRWSSLKEKTAWDWLQLLVVPIVLTVGGFLLSWQADLRQEKIAEDQRQQELLSSYLDDMSSLLGEGGLRQSGVGSETFVLAQAKTTTLFRQLDEERRVLLINFLTAANLYGPERVSCPPRQATDEEEFDIFVGGDLSGIDAQGLGFSTVAGKVDLRRANLEQANLKKADLIGANLESASLVNSNLQDAALWCTRLINSRLWKTNLSKADLRDSTLQGATLFDANLKGSNLQNTDFQDAILIRADLSQVENWTEEQLSKAKLCRTVLPEDAALDPDRDCDELGQQGLNIDDTPR